MSPSKPSLNNRPGTALLVIDVQAGLFTKPTPLYNAAQLLANLNSLVERAHAAGVPVIYVQHSDKNFLVKDSPAWQFHAEIRPQAGDLIVHKQHGNAFEDTCLEAELARLNVGHLVVTGLVTHGCVRATCLGAQKAGYRVTLVSDGHSSFSDKAAALIEEWNTKLSQAAVTLQTAAEISFAVPA